MIVYEQENKLPTREEAWEAFLNAWADEERPLDEVREAFDRWWRAEDE